MPLRHRLTYANVVSTLCLCLIVGGGVAYATHEEIRSSDIVDGTIKRLDIAPDTGKLYVGHKRVAGDSGPTRRKVLEVPGVATLIMGCYDASPGEDTNDKLLLEVKNSGNRTLRVSGAPGSLLSLAPEESTGGVLSALWDNAIFQAGVGGANAQLVTFVVSAQALSGSDECYAQAHAIAHR